MCYTVREAIVPGIEWTGERYHDTGNSYHPEGYAGLSAGGTRADTGCRILCLVCLAEDGHHLRLYLRLWRVHGSQRAGRQPARRPGLARLPPAGKPAPPGLPTRIRGVDPPTA